jgi:hypothetical protein
MTTPQRRPVVVWLAAVIVGLVGLAAATSWLRDATDRPASAVPAIEGTGPGIGPEDVPGCRPRGRTADVATVMPPTGRMRSVTIRACPAALDGVTVTFVGEVVGDVLRRPGGAWVLVNDDPYALAVGPLPAHRTFAGANEGLAVWVPDAAVGLLGDPGRAGRRGTVIEVVGTVVRTDPEDGGGLTLRAATVRVVAPAVPVDGPSDRPRAIAAAALLGLAASLRLLRSRTGRG